MLIPAGNYDSHTSKNEYSIVPNKRGVQIVGGGKTLENLISGGWGKFTPGAIFVSK